MTTPTLNPAYGALAALLVEMRSDWNLDQVLTEVASCPWSTNLIVQSVIAARDDDRPHLHVHHAIVKIPSQAQRMPDEQRQAYYEHAKRILNRQHASDT
ncbi:hypothetical protein AB0C10_15940 [Microbispora amethystogenes]|uniref:hypothetical protein n=1 Tax=Microbispora amethystogenes TaxID=1427754 RepID=UPI00340B78B5